MCLNIIYKKKMNDIVKFCDKKNCEKLIRYNKLVTGGNNPQISCRTRYSQQVQNYSSSRSTLDSQSNICKKFNQNIRNGVSNCPPSVLAIIANPPDPLAPNSISTISNNALGTKFSAFPCNNPIFRGQNIYSSRNVSVCKCIFN
jgi:hypothetical protein